MQRLQCDCKHSQHAGMLELCIPHSPLTFQAVNSNGDASEAAVTDPILVGSISGTPEIVSAMGGVGKATVQWRPMPSTPAGLLWALDGLHAGHTEGNATLT